MVEMYIDKEFQINKEFLDTIDFIPFLKEAQVLSALMGAVESYVFFNYKNMPPELEGEVFNYYSEEDFKDYLEKRYAKKAYFYPIEDYLIERIAKAKSNSKSHRILFKTFYEHINLPDDSLDQKKHARQRLPKKVQIYLDYYVKCNYIKNYNIDHNGITVQFK